MFLLFFYGVTSADEALSLIHVFLWMMVFGNLLALVDGFNIIDLGIIQQREDGRIGGPMGESNQYGAFLALILPATVAMLQHPGTKKLLAYFACFITMLTLLVTGSRGAFVGIVVGGVFAAFFLRSIISFRQVALTTVISIFAVTVIFVIFLSTDLFGDLVQRYIDKSSGNVRTMSSGRTEIWADTIQRMLEQPISFVTGFGWDAYDYMRVAEANTHNTYLNIIFNLGLPALLIYFVLVYNLFGTCRRALRTTDGIIRAHLIAFVFGFAALSASIFFVELYQPWIYIWAYVGLIMRLAISSIRAGKMETGRRTPALSSSTPI